MPASSRRWEAFPGPAAAPGKEVDRADDQGRSGERSHRAAVGQSRSRSRGSPGGGEDGIQDGSEGGARRNSQDKRVGKRIAQQRLESRPGGGKSGADQGTEEDARQADGKEDGGERIIGCRRPNQLVPQQPKQGPGRNRHAADGKREHDGASPDCQQSETYRGNAPSG